MNEWVPYFPASKHREAVQTRVACWSGTGRANAAHCRPNAIKVRPVQPRGRITVQDSLHSRIDRRVWCASATLSRQGDQSRELLARTGLPSLSSKPVGEAAQAREASPTCPT